METKVQAENLRYEIDGDEVEITMGIIVTVNAKANDNGTMKAMRGEFSKSITALDGHLTQAKRFSQGETVIGVTTEQPANRPFRVPTYTFGEEVPGVEWTRGPMPDQIKADMDDVIS